MRDELMNTKTKTGSRVDLKLASKILGTVPYNNAFYFFTNIGQYNGACAVDLADFCQKVQTLDVRSVDFHFKRGDFEEWIRGTLCDVNLANAISRIGENVQGEELRAKIYQTAAGRLTELKKMLGSKNPYIRRDG